MRHDIKQFTVVLITVAALWVVAAVPAHAQTAAPPTPPSPAATEDGPMNVAVRFWLNDILKFDPASGFTIDAFVAFVCDRPCGDLGIIIDNGKASSRETLADLPYAKAYRMELALTDVIDLHKYPFDDHELSVRILSARPAEDLNFVVDEASSGVGQIKLQGWQVDPGWHANAVVYPYDPFAQRSIPAYEFRIGVKRPALAGFFKTILPALAILLVGSFGLLLGPEERIKRFDLLNAAFLGTVLFQLNVLNSLPPLAYLTFADRFLLVNLISIIVGVGSSVWIILAYRAGAKARALDVHEWALAIVPLIWCSLQTVNVLIHFVLSPDDPRLWLVGVLALAIAAIVLPLRHRAMRTGPYFRGAYRRALRQTRSPQTALAQVLDIVASKPPFDTLTKTELDTLTDVFAPLPDPAVLADILVEAHRTGDVSILRDRAALERFAAFVTNRTAEPEQRVVATAA